jgi:hypothetical protein
MQNSSTNIDNNYYNLASALYHALKEAEVCSTYIQDAQQNGNRDMVNFFQEVQQSANVRADRAKSLLDSVRH